MCPDRTPRSRADRWLAFARRGCSPRALDRQMAKKRTGRRVGGNDGPSPRSGRWKNLDFLIRGNGDVTLGRVGPVHCAATAADGDQMLVALVRRPRESFEEFLDRFVAALMKRLGEYVFVDEINGRGIISRTSSALSSNRTL